jgi:hypothetical protein
MNDSRRVAGVDTPEGVQIAGVLEGRTIQHAWISQTGALTVMLDRGELFSFHDSNNWAYTTQPSPQQVVRAR